MITKRIKIELSHFFALSKRAQRLLISYFFMSMTYPIIGTFINAYIFKEKSDLLLFIIYFLGQFAGVPLAFYLNGLLLRKFNIRFLYFFGTCLLGIVPLVIVFYSGDSLINYFFYGAILGFGAGIHWANRNYFSLVETQEVNRTYFIGVNFTADTILSVIVTFLIGWSLVLGLNYQLLMVFSFLIIFIAGYIILKEDYITPKVSVLGVKRASKKWINIRQLKFVIGLSEGIIYFFPSFLILTYLGKEGILGTITSLASFITALIIYIYGRKSKSHHQLPGIIFSFILIFITSVIYTYFYNSWSIILYIIIVNFTVNFMWLNASPFIMNILDKEIKHEDEKYGYIYDGEVFLNIGRTFSLLFCLVVLFVFNTTLTLRYTPLIIYSIQTILVYFLYKKLLK